MDTDLFAAFWRDGWPYAGAFVVLYPAALRLAAWLSRSPVPRGPLRQETLYDATTANRVTLDVRDDDE